MPEVTSSTVILGGGFGGLACARALRARLATDHRITIVDRAPGFLVGAAKIWVMLGERTPEQAVRPRSALLPVGVSALQAEVLAIDPARRRVETSAGALEADHLVIALGAELDAGSIPGLGAAHSFYTLVSAMRLADALAQFAGGRLVLLVARTPIKCPPAPYEAAMSLHAALEKRGVRAATEFSMWTPERAPLTVAGAQAGEAVAAELAARRIELHPGHRPVEVDPARRTVRFDDGGETTYDLLIAVPPHRVPRVLVAAGLAEADGWAPVDPRTLAPAAGRPAPHVYVIGDAAAVPLPGRYHPDVPLALPKAGVFAAAQGEVVAQRIAAAVLGQEPTAVFEGRGACYVETGDGRAMRAGGDFFALPRPAVEASPATAETYREKIAWADRWLGIA